MNSKHLSALKIEPEEAIVLFKFATLSEMYRTKALYDIYKTHRELKADNLWDIMSLLTFIYNTARIQGIREERAKRTNIEKTGTTHSNI